MKKLLLFCCMAMAIAAMQAQIIHVPGDYPTIQEGINAATPGDTVLVDDGTYYEQIDFLGKKPLMVASQFLIDGDTSHISNTIIDGSQITSNDNGSIVTFKTGEDTTSVLCGFTITNGSKGTKFTMGSSVARIGAAICISRCGARILHNHITGNTINNNNGGTMAIGAGIGKEWYNDASWVVIEQNTITDNTCLSAAEQAGGGGIGFCGNVRIINNVIAGNQATGNSNALPYGGGVFVGNDPQWTIVREVYLIGNQIQDNTIHGQMLTAPSGAGASFQAMKVVASGNVIANNSAGSAYSIDEGGGMCIKGPRTGTVLSNNTFRENVTQGNGGALSASSMNQPHGDTLRIFGNYFLNNSGANGGAIHVADNLALLKNNVFSGNHADNWGGGLFLIHFVSGDVDPMAFLANNSLSQNDADVAGGAVFSFKAKPVMINSVFWNNSGPPLMGPEICISTGDDVLFGTPGSGDTLEIAFSDIAQLLIRGPVKYTTGNFTLDPLFLNTDSLQVDYGSPCMNTGTEEYLTSYGWTLRVPEYDILGMPRPQSTGIDVGAYELEPGIGIGDPANEPGLVKTYPNPFTNATTLTYYLGEPGMVTLRVVNGYGQTVAVLVNEYQQKGEQQVTWNAENLPAGIYYYRIEAGGKTAGGNMVKR